MAEILLLEKGPYISYANCGLPYYIGGYIPSITDAFFEALPFMFVMMTSTKKLKIIILVLAT